MADTNGRPVYAKQSVSLRLDQVAEIKRIADAEKHGMFSRVVQRAVDELIERRGPRKEQEGRAA